MVATTCLPNLWVSRRALCVLQLALDAVQTCAQLRRDALAALAFLRLALARAFELLKKLLSRALCGVCLALEGLALALKRRLQITQLA